MLNNTKKIKEIYDEIQRKIFYAVPGKWDELYLYASIIDRFGKVQTGEMYFYFLPKGIIRKNFINVYEVPSKYDIEEDEYMKVVKEIYNEIKLLREEFVRSGQRVWTNLTISIKNSRFKIEYNYDNLLGGEEAYYSHHIYWRYKYLHIEPQGKKERQAYKKYLANKTQNNKKNEEYDEGLYSKKEIKEEVPQIRNQLLSDKFTLYK